MANSPDSTGATSAATGTAWAEGADVPSAPKPRPDASTPDPSGPMVELEASVWDLAPDATVRGAADAMGVCAESAPTGAANGTSNIMASNATNDAVSDLRRIRSCPTNGWSSELLLEDIWAPESKISNKLKQNSSEMHRRTP